jgi:hypothetical protein
MTHTIQTMVANSSLKVKVWLQRMVTKYPVKICFDKFFVKIITSYNNYHHYYYCKEMSLLPVEKQLYEFISKAPNKRISAGIIHFIICKSVCIPFDEYAILIIFLTFNFCYISYHPRVESTLGFECFLL